MAANKTSATQTSMEEVWVEYAIGISALVIRVFSRCKILVGWQWQVDDYLAVLAIALFTQARDDAEAGAKWLFAGWYIYVSMIWSLKGIMLAFVSRLTEKLPEARLVRRVSVICLAAYVATIAVITDHCRPIRKLWQVYPYAGGIIAIILPQWDPWLMELTT
ncbi:glycosyl hydrolase 3 N terminal domain family protein [Apiospora sp. TS-2023a]